MREKSKRGSSAVERRTHTPKAAGSKPAPATSATAKKAKPSKARHSGRNRSALALAVQATARKARPLSPKQLRLVDEYLVDLNATQAAIRAGYSPKSANEQACKLLAKPSIAALVAAKQAARAQRTEITADVVLGELLRLARVDIAGAFDESGRLKPIHEIPEDVRRAICGVETDELFEGLGRDRVAVGVTRKVKFWDKVRALEHLARHLGLLSDRAVNLNLDLSKLSDEQLGRISRGEDPLAVLAGAPSRG